MKELGLSLGHRKTIGMANNYFLCKPTTPHLFSLSLTNVMTLTNQFSGLELEMLKSEARSEVQHSAKPAFTGVVLERATANEVNASIESESGFGVFKRSREI